MPSGITLLEHPQALVLKLKSSSELISSITVTDISETGSLDSLQDSKDEVDGGGLCVIFLTFLVVTLCCSGFACKKVPYNFYSL